MVWFDGVVVVVAEWRMGRGRLGVEVLLLVYALF